MTNQERAEKIWRILHGAKALPMLSTPERDIKFITSQLDEAVETYKSSPTNICERVAILERGRAEGFASAREKAADIAEDYDEDCVERIRAMEVDK